MDIFHFILLICILIGIYIIFNLDRKNRAYEILVQNYDEMLEGVKFYLKEALNKLITLDRQHVFEGDDDVGFFFKSLKEEYIKLNNNIAGIIDETTDEGA